MVLRSPAFSAASPAQFNPRARDDRFAGIVLVLGLSFAGGARATLQTPPLAGVQRPGTVLTGTLTATWGDPREGSGAEPRLLITLTDAAGQDHDLSFADGVLEDAGGLEALDRRPVTVAVREGFVAGGGRLVRAIAPGGLDRRPLADAPNVLGAQPWITILCRFADSPTVTPHPLSYFQEILGTAAPGMDHYWREVSYNAINLAGTGAVGWYNLPQPRSYYVYDMDGAAQVDADLTRLAQDCTQVADADVNFPPYVGINLVFNQNLDCCAWGGGRTLNRDGTNKSYRMTWLPPWAQQTGTFAHEMGHGFGFPHRRVLTTRRTIPDGIR